MDSKGEKSYLHIIYDPVTGLGKEVMLPYPPKNAIRYPTNGSLPVKDRKRRKSRKSRKTRKSRK